MRRIIIAVALFSLTCQASLHAATGPGNVDALMQLPHPVPIIMSNRAQLGITEAQAQALRDRIQGVFPQQIQGRMQQAAALEQDIRQGILRDNRSREQVAAQLDELAAIKRAVTDIHIDALNTLAGILSAEQMQQALALGEQQASAEPTAANASNRFRVDELALLPHPGRLVKTGEVQLTPEQQQQMRAMQAVYPPLFHPKMQQALELQRRLQRAVAKGKTKAEVKELLDDIARIKREAIALRIDALNQVRTILTPAQWDAVNRLTYE
jgi:Spy/CpxP family protein refolding chaperone